MDESHKQSSGSNGVVERAVQEVEGQMRALPLAVETRPRQEKKPTGQGVQFISEFVAYLLNRLTVGKGGRSATERINGKRAAVVGVQFVIPTGTSMMRLLYADSLAILKLAKQRTVRSSEGLNFQQ